MRAGGRASTASARKAAAPTPSSSSPSRPASCCRSCAPTTSTPQVNGLPCRSLAELERRSATGRARAAGRPQARAARTRAALARRREARGARPSSRSLAEREDGMALAWCCCRRWRAAACGPRASHKGTARHDRRRASAVLAVLWRGRRPGWLAPGFDDIDERLDEAPRREVGGQVTDPGAARGHRRSAVCVLDAERSRVTGAPAEDVPFDWTEDGCVNGRTQYGIGDGGWARVFVPGGRGRRSRSTASTRRRANTAWSATCSAARRWPGARGARANSRRPQCGAGASRARVRRPAAGGALAAARQRPNERLVYPPAGRPASGVPGRAERPDAQSAHGSRTDSITTHWNGRRSASCADWRSR